MIVLGVFDGHNASAALAVDGRIVGALQEERLSRVKNDVGTPRRAVAALLADHGLAPLEVDAVAVASRYVPAAATPDDIVRGFDARLEGSLRYAAGGRLGRLGAYRRWRAGLRMAQRTRPLAALGFDPGRVAFYDHHETHAATVYHGLRADDDPYLVVTLDGGGDGLCASVSIGRAGYLARQAAVPAVDSLGELYAVTTHALGFRPLEHEYKLMGMAAYAAPAHSAPVADLLRGYLRVDGQGDWRRGVREPMARIGRRLQRDLSRVRFDHVCAGLQRHAEEQIGAWIGAWVERTGVSRVLAAGGVFMNVKANKVVSELPGVTRFEAFPSCGDESLPFGACYLASRQLGVEPAPIAHCYLGNDLSVEECRRAAAVAGDAVAVESPSDLADRVAELLAAGEVVARAAGPMEFGARALGNRSILADPRNQDVVRVINRMIKRRDFWMPFAPVVLRRHGDRCFANPKGLPSPYMMNTFDSSPLRSEFMAAVHNADLTARPQLLEDGQNPLYAAILERFAQRTGRHVLLNTSFNLHGEPVVCSAEDAVRVLLDSGLRHLALGPLLVSKRPAP